MFSLNYAWINDWVNNREAGDLRRQHGHFDVIVMDIVGFRIHHDHGINECARMNTCNMILSSISIWLIPNGCLIMICYISPVHDVGEGIGGDWGNWGWGWWLRGGGGCSNPYYSGGGGGGCSNPYYSKWNIKYQISVAKLIMTTWEVVVFQVCDKVLLMKNIREQPAIRTAIPPII